MPEAYLRRLATSLLRLAIRIAPQETAEWGHAMLNEMNQVQGNWSALLWSLGGTGVLAKHALLSIIVPSRKGPAIGSSGELFAKEGPMRKTPLAVICVCAAASMLFFLAPVFRQAFRVSLTPWYYFLCSVMTNGKYQPSSGLEAIAREAEQKHDAEGIAFVAVMLWDDQSKSASLAEEAVHLDPKLTWVYAVVPRRFSSGSQIDRWVSELQKYDPQNALPYLIAARKIKYDLFFTKRFIPRVSEEPAAWRTAMAAAFQSPKFDNYCAQVKELDRRVVLRYGFDDPNRFFDGPQHLDCLGLYHPSDTAEYAKSVLEAGELLEARGDWNGAHDKYSAVVRSYQMMSSGGAYFYDTEVYRKAYKRLQTLSEKQGMKEQAQLYAYLGYIAQSDEQTHRAKEDERIARNRGFGVHVSRWNARLAGTSGLALLFSAGLLLGCLFAVIVRSRSVRFRSLRPGRLALALGTCGSVGLLLSSAILYATYRPYAEIFQRYLHTGNESEMREFSNFFVNAQFLEIDATEYWVGQVALCVIALFFVLTRSLVKHLRARVA